MTKPSARSLLSIVLPAYNERAVLPQTYERVRAMREPLARLGLDCEIVFVDDGSTDGTGALLDAMAKSDPAVRAVHLTRNFGHQAAVTAGLALSRGDAVVVMDCDLQDPPEIIPELVARWREGNFVVYTVRTARQEWAGKRLAYWSFYRLLARVSELSIPLDSGDFCLMDRAAVDLLQQLPERQRFVRGLRTWVGLKQTGVEYERPARADGTPAYTARALVKLAMDGLVSFSGAPLKMVTRLGFLSALGAVLLGVWVVWSVISSANVPRGWASLACLVLVMSAVQLLSLGIIGEYLSRVFLEVKGRPTFLIGSVVQQGAGAESIGPHAGAVHHGLGAAPAAVALPDVPRIEVA